MKALWTVSILWTFPALALAEPEAAPDWWEELGKLPDAKLAIETVIDAQISAKLAEVGVEPVSEASAETLLRRATLDLVGRIPTLAERNEFLANQRPDRWTQTVDRLLNSAEFTRHQAHELNWLLLDGKTRDFRNYLMAAVAEDRRWNEIFEEVILARASEENKGVDQFLREGLRDVEKLTTSVSVRFFGVDVSCAQCHNHPYVADWTQESYYGMQSFFSRSFDNGGFVAEREYGLVSYKTTAGDEMKSSLRFLGGPPIPEPEIAEPDNDAKKAEQEAFNQFKKDKVQPPAPEYSRRSTLIQEALTDENVDWFARSLTNRIWHRMFGNGLVMPLDQMHGQNAPSHPELLQWLANDLRDHQYDLRRLLRGIVHSEAWKRSSLHGSSERPDPRLFALAEPRALTPRQYGSVLAFGLEDPNRFAPETDAEELASRIEQTERSGDGIGNQFARPTDNFHVPVSEALFLSNGEDAFRRISGSGLIRSIKSDEADPVTLATQSILGREPEPDEHTILTEYLAQRQDRPDEALHQVIWALLTSAEARFNH